MGISCKPCGKKKSIFQKLENQIRTTQEEKKKSRPKRDKETE